LLNNCTQLKNSYLRTMLKIYKMIRSFKMKNKKFIFKSLYLGTVAALMFNTVTPAMANEKNESIHYELGDRNNVILLVKEHLVSIDDHFEFDKHEYNELFTEELKNAIESFQTEHQLEVNGQIDE